MPKNKNFQKRITILDECFASRTGIYTLKKLGKILEDKLEDTISRRTIQNDIKYIKETIEMDSTKNYDLERFPVFMKGLFGDTNYTDKQTAFRYSKVEYALGNQMLNKPDKEQLSETLAILSRYKNREDFYWLDELFPRIESAFDLVSQDVDGIISYQSNKEYIGRSWLGLLYTQLIRKKVLNIEYKSFKQESSVVRRIHPYHLKQYNNRWFLFGYEEFGEYNGITNLALDRIIGITETTDDIRPNDIKWSDYFNDIIGVSHESGTIEKILLRFDPDRLKYVQTKPLHSSWDEIEDENGDILISIDVKPNKELYQLLLSFGSDVEVLEPEFIREKLKLEAEKLKKQYEK